MIGAYQIFSPDTPPSGPTTVVLIPVYATANSTSVLLKWLPLSTQIKYNVYVNGIFHSTVLDSSIGSDGLIATTITGLAPNTAYKFTVSDANGDSGSTTVTTTPQTSAQAQPPTATPTPTKIPNYLLWGGIAAGAYLLLRKK
ncbi:MAG: fibronectin type III domain-containing protein [Patescibacteria group bacterium]|nr:fibronectin type III domain-containing protein [Patescibacteria group bacterium]